MANKKGYFVFKDETNHEVMQTNEKSLIKNLKIVCRFLNPPQK